MLRSIGDGVIASDLDGTVLSDQQRRGSAHRLAPGRGARAAARRRVSERRSRHAEALRERHPARSSDADDASGARRSTLLVARDLTERPIEECAAPLRDGAGRTIGMVLAFRDISDALRVQEERARAGRLASLGLLAGGIAHDFNNILMAIMGNISMARATIQQAGAAAAARRGGAGVRARAADHVAAADVLEGRRAGQEDGRDRARARRGRALALRGSNVTCTFDLAPDLWPIEADEAQLVQVFTNLLINAQQAMPHGGVVAVRAENVVRADGASRSTRCGSRPGAYVRVSVADQGIGIPKEHLSRIFDPYFSTKQRGSGLGLATTYSIVKNHGGLIGVDSQLGQGTTMEVHFPASALGDGRDARARATTAMRARSPSRPDAAGRVLLVMDDEASVRTLAANMLEFLGYDAEIVDNGSAAIERFKRARRRRAPVRRRDARPRRARRHGREGGD